MIYPLSQKSKIFASSPIGRAKSPANINFSNIILHGNCRVNFCSCRLMQKVLLWEKIHKGDAGTENCK